MSTPRKRLVGWKAIAGALGRTPRTAQLWERSAGLPVYRLNGSLYAYGDELDAWLHQGCVGGASRARETAEIERSPGLLVLPFDYHCCDQALALVGDGLAEELIGRLATSRLSDMRVLSWTTSKAYRSAGKHAREIAADLGVRYLIEGNVIAAGSRWRIDARVVDAHIDQVILSDAFGCDAREVLLMQAQIAEAVASQLSMHIAGESVESMWSQEVDPNAFLCYLRAVQGLGRRSAESLDESMRLADEALAIEPSFLPARATKGLALLGRDLNAGFVRPETRESAHRIAAQCLAEGPELLSTLLLDGQLATFEYDWDRAEARYLNGIDSVPASTACRGSLVNNLVFHRKFEDAQTIARPLLSLERSLWTSQIEGFRRLWQREYEVAIAGFDDIVAREPCHSYANAMRIMAALYLGDNAGARDYIAATKVPAVQSLKHLFEGCLAANEERFDDVREARQIVLEQATNGRLPWYHVAMLDGRLGDAEAAANHVRRSAQAMEATCLLASVDPSLDRVRDDLRFRSVVRAIGLPE